MKPVVKSIICPKCGKKQNFTIYPSISASSEPNLAEKYLDGTLTTLICGECGFSGVVEYPVFYHDLNKKFSIFFEPNNTERELKHLNVLPSHLLPKMYLRLVHSTDEFREKIFIFRDHLDDRIIETVKDAILREMEAHHEKKMPDELYYAQDILDCEGHHLIFVPKKEKEYLDPIKIPFETYEKIKRIMHSIWDRPIEGYTVVDKYWVQSDGKKEQT
ncbi:MAG TPA: CpXC domain-containing protein [Methanocorpusculum sp.]|nr:CpXC domain-containing protein [Methanocorpusculum sp.]